MIIQIKARQAVIIDGKHKGFNPQKPHIIVINFNKQLKSINFVKRVKYLKYTKKTIKIRKARINLLKIKIAKIVSGKIEYLGYKIPKNKFKFDEILIGLFINNQFYYFK